MRKKKGKKRNPRQTLPREKKNNEGKTERHVNNTGIQENTQSQAVHPYVIAMQ